MFVVSCFLSLLTLNHWIQVHFRPEKIQKTAWKSLGYSRALVRWYLLVMSHGSSGIYVQILLCWGENKEVYNMPSYQATLILSGDEDAKSNQGRHSLTVPASMSCVSHLTPILATAAWQRWARSELQRFKEWPTNTTQPETFKMTQTLNWIVSIYTMFSVEALDINLLWSFMVNIIASFTTRRWDVKYGLRTSTTDSNAVSAADGKTLQRARKNNSAWFNNRRTLKGVFVCAALMSNYFSLPCTSRLHCMVAIVTGYDTMHEKWNSFAISPDSHCMSLQCFLALRFWLGRCKTVDAKLLWLAIDRNRWKGQEIPA